MASNGDHATLRKTDRSTVRRKRDRGSFERSLAEEILDEALVAHVGFTSERGPVVLPMTFARVGDALYLHGAVGNAMLRSIAGRDVCVTVTLLDGLVLAKSAFHHSMNYRCVVLFGIGEQVTDGSELRTAMDALLEHLVEGRSAAARPPTDAELRSTLVVRVPIEEGSVKVRTGDPIDDEEDLALPHWAGVIPIETVRGEPQPV